MTNIDFNLINTEASRLLDLVMNGRPTENRLVIAVSTAEKKSNGLIIPNLAKEEIPKKGVVVQKGPFTEDFQNYDLNIHIGDVLTYGLYAGKQIYPTFNLDILMQTSIDIPELIQSLEFYVISAQEIIYIEPNK